MFRQCNCLSSPLPHYAQITVYCFGVLRQPLYSVDLQDWTKNLYQDQCLDGKLVSRILLSVAHEDNCCSPGIPFNETKMKKLDAMNLEITLNVKTNRPPL
uniref:CSON000825 protein n=1 Tax=Culicoides sonorensis TaxID=179676 RepID=A0A336KV88_CULSO